MVGRTNVRSKYIENISKNKIGGIVVTSRPSRIPSLESTFSWYQVNPFSDKEIEMFLEKWFVGKDKILRDILSKLNHSGLKVQRFKSTD